jgi:hypothetical protein
MGNPRFIQGNSRFPTLYGKADDGGHSARVQQNINAVLEPIARAVSNTPIMGAPPPAWTYPDLLNGWVNHGPPFATVAFHRDALFYVHVKGVAHNDAGGPNSAPIFVLPVGWRPAETNSFVCATGANGRQNVTLGRDGSIDPDGSVPNNGHVHFAMIFLAEQ